jgi:uncharacterized protein
MGEKVKLFKDPVHGYISIPTDYCSAIVDTPIFQRLRHIEQTSMRPLYPAAHHDRFIHSIGTYYLGKKAFEFIISNSDSALFEDIEGLRNTFLMACLLHDCGHAPFSHTFEYYYNYPVDEDGKGRGILYLESLISQCFCNDLAEPGCDPADHETFSAAILLSFYKEKIECLGGDPELAARMITGCHYYGDVSPDCKVKNKFIELLNGVAIDVDKLDYIMRDTWASGVHNVTIDVDRLLRALMIDGNTHKLCFGKSALSIIQNVVDGRNYLHWWIYNHHTVLYYAEVLESALKKLADIFAVNDNRNRFWEIVFSKDPFYGPVSLGYHRILLPTDGDLLFLMKHYLPTSHEVYDIFSHNPRRFTLWKTFAEFKKIFQLQGQASRRDLSNIRKHAIDTLADTTGRPSEDFLLVETTSKYRTIEENDLFLKIDAGRPVSFSDLFEPSHEQPTKFFYIFAPLEYIDQTNNFIDRLKQLRL